MKPLTLVFVGVVSLVGLSGQVAEPAEWEFHDYFYDGAGFPDRLTVYGTIDCVAYEPPLFQGWVEYCDIVTGCVPDWCNDLLAVFEWAPDYDDGCHNVDQWKAVVLDGVPGDWVFLPLEEWIDILPVPLEPLPTVGDPTGQIQYVYVVVNLRWWEIDPRPLQDEYWVEDGWCYDLPGYYIGTTPIEFRPWEDSPFYTEPLTGWLSRDGDLVFRPYGATATESPSWGSIKALYR